MLFDILVYFSTKKMIFEVYPFFPGLKVALTLTKNFVSPSQILMCVFRTLVNTMGPVHPVAAHSSVLVHQAGREGFVRKVGTSATLTWMCLDRDEGLFKIG